MSFAKKMARAKARPAAKRMAIADRQAEKRAYMDGWQMHADQNEVTKVLRARCHIHSIIGLWLLLKEFKVTAPCLRSQWPRFETLNWCLAHSYTKEGKVVEKPSVGYDEMEQCLKDECKFILPRFSIEHATTKQSYCRQKLDGCMLVSLFLSRTCFGFGRVRLTRFVELMRALVKEITFERYVEMGRYVIRRLGYDEQAKLKDFVAPEDFGAWIYEEATA